MSSPLLPRPLLTLLCCALWCAPSVGFAQDDEFSDDEFSDDEFSDDEFSDDDFGGDDGFGEDDGFGDDGFGDAGASESAGLGDGKGVLATTFQVGAGAFVGRRDFSLVTDTLDVDQYTPLIGTGAHLRFAVGLLEDAMQVGVDADFAYAPLSASYQPPSGGETESLSGQYVRGGGIARAAYAFLPFVAIGAHVGADVVSTTTDPNATYTGHRYIWLRTGLELSIIPVESFRLTLRGSALPVLSALSSGDAYGVGDGGFGSELSVTGEAKLTARLGVRGEYRFTQVGVSDYSDAAQGQGDPDTGDRIDTGLIALSLLF